MLLFQEEKKKKKDCAWFFTHSNWVETFLFCLNFHWWNSFVWWKSPRLSAIKHNVVACLHLCRSFHTGFPLKVWCFWWGRVGGGGWHPGIYIGYMKILYKIVHGCIHKWVTIAIRNQLNIKFAQNHVFSFAENLIDIVRGAGERFVLARNFYQSYITYRHIGLYQNVCRGFGGSFSRSSGTPLASANIRNRTHVWANTKE